MTTHGQSEFSKSISKLAERAARVRIAVVLRGTGARSEVVWPTAPEPVEALRWLLDNNTPDERHAAYRAISLGSHPSDRRPLVGIIPVRSEINTLFDPQRAESLCRALSTCLVADLADADRLITALGFTADDLALADSVESAADDLAEKLADAYECNVLMHGLSRMLNRTDALELQIVEACAEIAGSLGFAWASIVFEQSELLPRAVRRAVIGGGPECPEQEDLTNRSKELLYIACIEKGSTAAAMHEDPNHGVTLIQPIVIADEIVATLVLAGRGEHRREIDSYDLTLIESVGGFLGPFIENSALDEERERAFYGMLRALSAAVDAKDPYTRGHSERVAMLSVMIAQKLGLPPEQIERIRVAGIVHDIGKIGVPEHILTKPDRLTEEEFEIIKTHPVVGYTILESVHELEDVLPGVLHHHERWDGKGYPHALVAEATPEIARILAVADSFDAMSSTRAYRMGMSPERALEQIRSGSGTQFDPRIAEAFLALDLAPYYKQLAREEAARQPAPQAKAA
ncbi:MAG: HD-GYP domain-containing protein [Phycisphaerales bacterium]